MFEFSHFVKEGHFSKNKLLSIVIQSIKKKESIFRNIKAFLVQSFVK